MIKNIGRRSFLKTASTAGLGFLIGCNFKNDLELIAKATITVIYNLRNSLFHGQLVPNRNTQLVYEPAYHILRMLVTSLS